MGTTNEDRVGKKLVRIMAPDGRYRYLTVEQIERLKASREAREKVSPNLQVQYPMTVDEAYQGAKEKYDSTLRKLSE